MKRVHILSPGFVTQNSRAFLFPLVVWRETLREADFDCRLFAEVTQDLTDCDTLLIDSKFHRDRWAGAPDRVVEEFAGFAQRCRVIYCDTTDSSGWVQTKLLPIVHGYAKSQLIEDRSAYSKPMYAYRPFTDYYHRKFGVDDAEPEWSQPITDTALLRKLRLSWNSGLADYSLYGPMRMALYYRMPLPGLLAYSRRFVPPSSLRTNAVSGRFAFSYSRETVAIQRRLLRDRLSACTDTQRRSRRVFLRDLENSKIIVSPFGWGEIALKDFEAFLAGGLLIKPDMSHMETWPDFFRAGETILAHAWDLSDFDALLERAVANYSELRDVAVAGQDTYRKHTIGPQAAELFVAQLRKFIAADV